VYPLTRGVRVLGPTAFAGVPLTYRPSGCRSRGSNWKTLRLNVPDEWEGFAQCPSRRIRPCAPTALRRSASAGGQPVQVLADVVELAEVLQPYDVRFVADLVFSAANAREEAGERLQCGTNPCRPGRDLPARSDDLRRACRAPQRNGPCDPRSRHTPWWRSEPARGPVRLLSPAR
jgi:hypothetical protein